MPVTCVSTLVLAFLLAAPPPVGLEVAAGRIEQIDRGDGVINTWLRPSGGQPILVQSNLTQPPPPVGAHVRVHGTPLEDHVQAARDGHTRIYRAVRLSGPWETAAATSPDWWLPAVIAALFGLFLALAILAGRRRPNRRIKTTSVAADTVACAPPNLPSDPALALAELARTADEEGA